MKETKEEGILKASEQTECRNERDKNYLPSYIKAKDKSFCKEFYV